MVSKESLKKLEHTLPYKHYVDAEIFKEEQEKIFSKSWIMVGHTSQVEKNGDFFTFEIGGQSIIISRDSKGTLNAFYNICPHRGAKVERSESGNKKIFMCSYHGWTFHLDGKVNKAPNFKTYDLGEHSCMIPIQLAVHQSMVFINLDPHATPFLSEYESFIENSQSFSFLNSLKKVRVNKRVIDANWKAVIDNYLECDHCQIAHPSFSKTFDMNNYNIIPCDNFSYQYSKVKNDSDNASARFYWIWPNLLVSIYPGTGNMTTSQIIPINTEKTLAIYSYYFANENLTEKEEELIRFVDQVREEDFELVELLQSGFHSKAFKQGIFSPSEQGLYHFHKLIQKAMNIKNSM